MNILNFFYQGGYGFFVWGAYSMGVFLLIAEIFLLQKRHKTILANIKRMLRRHAQEQSRETTS